MTWAWKEACGYRLPDVRLDWRLAAMVEAFAEHPEASCTEALGKAGAKAAYRFWDNDRIEPQQVLAAHAGQTARRSMEYSVVLVAQDTSEINLTDHPATAESFPQHPHVVLIGDRESDLFDLFAAPRPGNVDLLVRVCREKRRVEHPAKYLDAALESEPIRGHVQIHIPARPNRQARRAKMAVRWLSLEVHAPRHGPKRPSLRLTFILVEELDPPKGEKPVRWLLAATLSVESLEDALECVPWYAYRWTIERFHFVLKSGCKIEQRQLETVERMERAIPVFSIVAWRLLWLTLQARETPEAPCTSILADFEWKVLYATAHRTRQLPPKPPTLREAVRLIAQLGGFLGRKHDGEPGPQTIWRGLRRLSDLSQGWLVAQQEPPVS
jgi:hypothetical protein